MNSILGIPHTLACTWMTEYTLLLVRCPMMVVISCESVIEVVEHVWAKIGHCFGNVCPYLKRHIFGFIRERDIHLLGVMVTLQI